MDRRVLDVPWPVRRLIVSAFILPTRPKQSAEAYAKIWREEGSPLLYHSRGLADALENALEQPVALAMRYGSPSVADGFEALEARGVTRCIVAPLYPHYADSTTTTSFEAAESCAPESMEIVRLAPFYADPGYIQALADVTRAALPEHCDYLLMSYHGLPERHLTKADPTGNHCLQSADCCERASAAHATCYRHQSRVTSRLLAEALGLDDSQYGVSYQSRLGRLPWLTPYTDATLVELAEHGVKHLAVVCPAFVADNLETLEEIGLAGKEAFLAAGGESFTLVPCLNEDERWVDALGLLLKRADLAVTG